MHGIRVETRFNDDMIEQTIRGPGLSGEIIIKSIIRLKEQGVRDALISLGWTPPNRKGSNDAKPS